MAKGVLTRLARGKRLEQKKLPSFKDHGGGDAGGHTSCDMYRIWRLVPISTALPASGCILLPDNRENPRDPAGSNCPLKTNTALLFTIRFNRHR